MFGVVTVIFFLFNVLPGDPAQMMLGQNENSEQLNIVKKKYGFDKSLSNQYFLYLNDLSPIVNVHTYITLFAFINFFDSSSTPFVSTVHTPFSVL